ncbi:expansin-like EG45 domain-containing protein [Favolaschia claudopus]|uniref:Expansin-like EG45 domain-containing protein n=1 Tax=Favolaschia claudopus TaxID=2862362 RepID=A0AAW0AA46_9AGAR
MNATKTAYVDNQFGPPSELISIAHFIQSTSQALAASVPEFPPGIAEQCSVADIRDSLNAVADNPRLMAHLIKTHEFTVSSLHMAAEKPTRSRKRPPERDTMNDTPETVAFQQVLDNVPLESCKLTAKASIFIRPVKSTDQNILPRAKMTRTDDGRLSADVLQAVITFTVNTKLSWRQTHVSRSSKHIILSSQTLGDLFECIPCTSNELPEETVGDGNGVTGYSSDSPRRPGCVICIEGLAYGDGESEVDYADKLIQHLQTFAKDSPPALIKATTSMHDTPLSTLSLRIGEPYWVLHQGNCEHFIVIDQIRLQHPSDMPSGYPLTIQITPPAPDVCRGCTKVPAALSIVNDERLGETPCPLCIPCWTAMGNPQNDKVLVVPFPKYEIGW